MKKNAKNKLKIELFENFYCSIYFTFISINVPSYGFLCVKENRLKSKNRK